MYCEWQQLDNFTSVSSRGKAVVDYCITSYTGLEHVTDFRVHLVTQLCEMLGFKGDYRLPDHSLVSWLWEVHEDVGTTDANSQTYGQQEVRSSYIRAVPEGFLEDVNDSFYKLSQLSERDDGNPEDVTDTAYQQFCSLLNREVEKLKVSTWAPVGRRHMHVVTVYG